MLRSNLARSGGRVTTPNIGGNNFPSTTARTAASFPRLEEISNGKNQSDPVYRHASGTPPAAITATCSACMKPGCVKTDNLLHILQHLNKPFYRTSAIPGRAPSSTRWICRLCQGRKHITTRSSDLRVHLRSQPHNFTESDVRAAFDPKHLDAPFEHFGPCTVEQAEDNGWLVRAWSREDPTEHGAETRIPDVTVDLAHDEDWWSFPPGSLEPRDSERSRAFYDMAKRFAEAFKGSPYRITLEGSKLHFTSRFNRPEYIVQREQSISEGSPGIESNASNNYFNGVSQRVRQSPMLPATGTQFGDSPSNEPLKNAPDIEEFGGNYGPAGQDEHESQMAGARLKMTADQMERRPSLPPTHWNNDTLVQLQGPAFHTEQQLASAPAVLSEDMSGTTFFPIHKYVYCGLPYAYSVPGGSETEAGDVSMPDIEENLSYSFVDYLNSVD